MGALSLLERRGGIDNDPKLELEPGVCCEDHAEEGGEAPPAVAELLDGVVVVVVVAV